MEGMRDKLEQSSFHFEQPDTCDEDFISRYRELVVLLRQGDLDAKPFKPLYSDFILTDGLLLALQCEQVSAEDVDSSVKLPDLVANACAGKMEESVEQLCTRVWRAIHGTRILTKDAHVLLPDLLSKFALNYGMIAGIATLMVKDCTELAKDHPEINLDALLKEMSVAKQETVFKVLISACSNGRAVANIVGNDMTTNCKSIFEKILFRTRSISETQTIICFLSIRLSPVDLTSLLMSALRLWADPVIARAHVNRETIHVTKAAFLLFCHLQPKDVISTKGEIVGMLVKGLPNHFNSTDGRTVALAHFFSKLVTDTITFYEDGTEVPSEVRETEDPLGREVLDAFVPCDESKHFWHIPVPTEKMSDLNVVAEEEKKKEEKAQDSDDDDSDVEPLDEFFPKPEKELVQIKFIRNFLESLPDLKTYDDVHAAFKALPAVIQRQLSLEHPRVGIDVLESVFTWENEFEDPKLDELRKTSLCNVLREVPVGNTEYFLEFFHREHVQSYRKAIILDVVSKVSKDLSLVDLQHVTRCVFRKLLKDDFTIARQDVTVRIPFVMTLSRLLCLLPEPMVEEFMVVEFLSALRNMGQVDAATEQTVCYALSNVMNAIGQYKVTAEMQEGMKSTRDWLLAVQSSR